MGSDLDTASALAVAGLKAQTTRMRIASENLANADSTATAPGADPYRRRVPVFQSFVDAALGAKSVRVRDAVPDQSAFKTKFEPGHPAADAQGYVRLPNVDPLVELVDLREAQRAYEANLNIIESARSMRSRVLDLLRK